MKFIKGHVYACSFEWGAKDEYAIFYGVYKHSVDKIFKYFSYISCENYGNWHADEFSFEMSPNTTFTDLGTIKQNPEFFI